MKGRAWAKNELPTADPQWAPAAIKISLKTDQEIEVKVSYQSSPEEQKGEQLYEVDLYGFVPEQLTASETGVYSHLQQIVRLHTPQVALESLGREDGGGYLPPHLVADLQRRLARPARDMQSKDVTALASTATASFNQTLRLYACVYRTALRRLTKELIGQLKAEKQVAKQLPITVAATSAPGQGAHLPPPPSQLPQWPLLSEQVTAIDFGIRAVLARFQQVCDVPALLDLPEDVQQAVSLIEEFLIFESDRSLMKLLSAMDKCLLINQATPPGAPLLHAADGGDVDESTPAPQQSVRAVQRAVSGISELRLARTLVGQTILDLEADLDAKGMEGSILRPDDDRLNELFTYHQKVLKRNVRRAVSLSPSESKPSFWFADLIGSIVSGFAMFLAVLSILLAQAITGSMRYTVVFAVILIAGYIIKDRIKEWGKRYLEAIGKPLGVRFPDRIRHLRAYEGTVCISPPLRDQGVLRGCPSRRMVVKRK
mmetsp:Transcript_18321/g.55144  ORF Transcript_18321/g.55144 Transcript_18321/m.55144 type:complete len:485 (-) Transcript_18321:330-1784(-)